MDESGVANIFDNLPEQAKDEVFDDLLRAESVRIERIVSQGHTSPEEGWYDQDEHEWVIVLRGGARIAFDDGGEVALTAGDYLHIPAHRRHRVSWTDPSQPTVWLAVFHR